MEPMLQMVRYLFGRARCRARAALDGQPESGALTLEWIVIAGILVVAAGVAGVIFTTAIHHAAKQLP
ncbi:MAG: hypothetical protein ACLPUO_13275 [Streptosporangiaceae bacterium]|jgi:hypothetical protein